MNSAQDFEQWLKNKRICVLTGAGISTDSGIPYYRGPKTKHKERNPIKHDQFIQSALLRQRYWARASRGFRVINSALPNDTHYAIAQLEMQDRLSGVITQNVDGLHQAAGSKNVIELHGSLHRVQCLSCKHVYVRDQIQTQISNLNPGWLDATVNEVAPDGDAELNPDSLLQFKTPLCVRCQGDLMPDVVFFGGSVPKLRSEAAYDLVDHSDALLVLGSSLSVFSGYRFVRHAHRAEKPIAIVSLGETRGDKHATLKVDVPLAEINGVLALG